MATVGIKASPVRIPVDAISTSNLTLSAPQTVDTVSLTAGMLCGALGQSDNKNAVYLVQDGAWLPVNPGFGTGLEVYATGGSANVNAVYGCDTTGAITWGTTTTTFTLKSSGSGAVLVGTSLTLGGFTTLEGGGLYDGLKIEGTSGAEVTIAPGPSATARVNVTHHPFTLANNGTYNFGVQGPGHVTISSGTIVGTLGFAADGTTTLGGLAPTNLTATLTSANKLNVGMFSSGTIQIENKTGGSVSGVATVASFVAA